MADATGRARHRREEMAVEVALDLLAPAPRSVLGLLGSLANHQPLFNLVVTNVPGPPVTLYFCGARLLEAYPLRAPGREPDPGRGRDVLRGTSSPWALLADPLTCPDAEVMVSGIEEDLDRLVAPERAGAGRRARVRQRRAARPRPPPAAVARFGRRLPDDAVPAAAQR